MSIHKPAPTNHPIHDLLQRRWSPYGYSGAGVKPDDLKSIMEAARWAPSSYNEQPWRFLVARREDTAEFEKLLSTLVEMNQAWARHAGVLIVTVVSEKFTLNGKPNAAAEHDIGLAAMSLSIEAQARGYHTHQMIGLDPEKVRALYEIPEGFHALTAIAIGVAAAPDKLPEKMQKNDEERRPRKALSEIVYTGKFGNTSSLV